MWLSSALSALVDAHLAVITAVARGDDQAQFECLMVAIEAKRDAALAAGVCYQRFLLQVGRADEAQAVAADLAALITSTPPMAASPEHELSD